MRLALLSDILLNGVPSGRKTGKQERTGTPKSEAEEEVIGKVRRRNG